MDSRVGETLMSRTNALIDDKVAGRFGRSALVVGFAAQIIGYAVIVGTDASAEPSGKRAVGALIATLIGAALVSVAYLSRRKGLVRAETIAVANHTPQGEPTDQPDGHLLALLHMERYESRRVDGESFVAFNRRVWKVHDATEPPRI